MSGKYERELRDILEGNIAEYIKTIDETTVDIYNMLKSEPFRVMRGAGSFGVDLVAMRYRLYLPIEVKSSSDEVIYFSNSKRLQEQVEEYIRCSRTFGLPIVYARRMKDIRGERWAVYRLDTSNCGELLPDVPVIPTTSNGTRKLVWGEGMILSDFIRILFDIVGGEL